MTKPYDIAVFIGRFQPFHNGHMAVIEQATKQAHRVLVLVGSSNLAPDTRNPFDCTTRRRLISTTLDYPAWLTVMPLPDSDAATWIEDVQHAVKRVTNQIAPRVCIIGHERDHTSGYLRWFPQWDYIGVKDPTEINATAIREAYLNNAKIVHIDPALPIPAQVADYLEGWRESESWRRLVQEREKEIAYKEKYGDKEPHLTADAVCFKSGHVLLIRRKEGALGGGMLALPGGFKDRGENLFQTACRELREETLLDVTNDALALSLRSVDVFDDPMRSRRGEIVTVAHTFDLGVGALPQVQASDDAEWAGWVPISEITPDKLFEDHAFIIRNSLKTVYINGVVSDGQTIDDIRARINSHL